MTESIAQKLIDAAEYYMEECLEESVFQGRIKARTNLEQLAKEVDLREVLWRELDSLSRINNYLIKAPTQEGADEFKSNCIKLTELRKQLGVE
jgi:hypothetical protein